MHGETLKFVKALNLYMLAWIWPQCGRNM